MAKNDQQGPDYLKQAAHHLRSEAQKNGLRIRSSHAHMLVSAALGFNCKQALEPAGVLADDPWLSQEAGNVEKIREVIPRLRQPGVTPEHAPFIAQKISEGLMPACSECGRQHEGTRPADGSTSHDNPWPDLDTPWVCPNCVAHPSGPVKYGRCRCCGEEKVWPIEQIDNMGLCPNHHGEFDYDEEEQADRDSLIEFWQNHDD